ncbi:MAG: 4-demethylwyosine synthase TYW1, partial [Candidatus Woesearchaeota archaeon]
MVTKELKDRLTKQQYGFTGEHSAVKICNWTKRSLKDDGVCYKEKFYGIKSHRCCQITPSVGFCQNRCIFCWREIDLNEGTGEISETATNIKLDEPEDIIEESIKQHRMLLTGFGGNEKVNMEKFREAQDPNQFAISLTGEPTLYPRLNELIKSLKRRDSSVFVVSNGLCPEAIRNMEPPTQLYVSLEASDEEDFLKIVRPGISGAWEKLMQSLDALRSIECKTALRITVIKGINMKDPEKFGELIKKASPTYVEVKAYMHVGASRERLKKENMPSHEEIRDFSAKIARSCGYDIKDEQEESLVV